MNEELKQRANELLLKLLNGVEEGSGFLIGELPEVLEQLLMFKAVEALIISGCLAIVAVVILESARRLRNFCEDATPGSYLLSFAAIFPLALAVREALPAIKIWIAPKVYLLEYAAEVVK